MDTTQQQQCFPWHRVCGCARVLVPRILAPVATPFGNILNIRPRSHRGKVTHTHFKYARNFRSALPCLLPARVKSMHTVTKKKNGTQLPVPVDALPSPWKPPSTRHVPRIAEENEKEAQRERRKGTAGKEGATRLAQKQQITDASLFSKSYRQGSSLRTLYFLFFLNSFLFSCDEKKKKVDWEEMNFSDASLH